MAAQLHTFLENTLDCVLVLDADWRFVFLNTRAVSEIAMGRDLIGQMMWEAFPELDDSALGAAYRRAMADRVVQTLEAYFAPLAAWYELQVTPTAGGLYVCFRNINERKLMERQLREAEEHYRHTIELAAQIFWTADPAGIILNASPRWLTMTGQRPDDARGTGWASALHPEDREATLASWSRSVQTGSAFDVRQRLRQHDGSYRWFRVRAAPRRDAEGDIMRWYGSVEDVHNQVEAEARLKESEERLRLAKAAAGVGIWEIDLVQDEVTLSPESLAMHGLPATADGVLGSLAEWASLIHPDDIPAARAAIAQSVANGGLYDRTFRVRTADGVRFIQGLGRAEYDEDGKPRRILGINIDVTARREAELQLENSRNLLQNVIDSVTDLIFVKDRSGHFVLINHALTEGCGDLLGHRTTQFFEEHLTKVYEDVDQEVITTGHAQTVDEIIPIKGEPRLFQTAKVPWRIGGEIAGIIGVSRDITERKEAEERILWSATHDALTEVPNRTLFNERLAHALRHARRSGVPVGLLHLDLDHFKEVNDSLGHDAGDAVLKDFADRLKMVVRSGDTIARLGGDEFAVVLPGIADNQDLERVLESILMRMREPFIHQGRILDCRASIGASIFPIHGATAEELLKNADIALYMAKTAGRGRLMVFRPEMRQELQQRASMVEIARDAIRDDRIIPYYQPKVDLGTRQIVGFEALLRWRQSSGPVKAPGGIAAAFEDLEVASAISGRMIERTIGDVRHWLDRGLPFGHVAINAAASEFRSGGFAEGLLEGLRRAGVPTRCFQLEVTETVFLGRGAEHVTRALRLLGAEGVRIVLDDFGTGYASLSHLKQLPVNSIKIDRSFVQDMEQDPDDEAIIRSIVGLGHSLGLDVVAEGIETEAQAAHLRRIGCRFGQGFLYSKAVAAADVPVLLGI